MRTKCDMLYFPLGFKSQRTGTRFPISVKSSRQRFTPAECAMARRWRQALVEPPKVITTVIAFSKAFLVIISDGRIFFSIRLTTASPASLASFFFSSEIASWAELSGKLIPKASIADDIVFAVYIPPHEPGPGMALFSISRSSFSSMLPPACAPTASKTETMSRFFSL